MRVRQGEDSAWSSSRVVRTESTDTVFSGDTQDVRDTLLILLHVPVNGLQPFTVYSFKVLAVNGVGEVSSVIDAMLTSRPQSNESEASYYMITLREAPSGKPTITSAHNSSSSSICLAWAPPHPSTLHGEFLGYRLTYRPRYKYQRKM